MEFIGGDPGRKVMAYFLMAIIVGGIVLSLPISHGNRSVAPLDALFTATSAVCVTGLVVVDTGQDFSFFGQVVILTLIQLGGLGIMTFATVLVIMAGSRLAFRDRIGVTSSLGAGAPVRAESLLGAVMLVTFVIEAIGALILFLLFVRDFPPGLAAWHAIFHSISAFCNAGFSTFPTNFEGYAGSTPMLLTIALLIIVGGLGFTVIVEIFHRAAGHSHRISLHTRICLSSTAILLAAGFVVFFFTEYDNTLRDGSLAFKTSNAFFQSVVCRTAGFNSIPQGSLSEVGVMMAMILMFIGGCPGSTAGGIKTTTFTLIILTVWSRFRGHRSPAAFHRTISQESVIRAVAVFILATFVIAAAVAFLTLAWDRPPLRAGSVNGWLAEGLFEVISAFGTVGLSMGITPLLSPMAKIVIIGTMFIGRVGLLTLAFGLARPPIRGELVFAEEPVTVG